MDLDRLLHKLMWHLLESVVLGVLLIIVFPMILTLANVIFRGNYVVYGILTWLFIGAYFAFPEKIRLDRDTAQMREFRKQIPDGTYSKKEDAKKILRSMEFRTDVLSLLVTAGAAVLIFAALFFLQIMTPPIFLEMNLKLLWLLIPAALLIAVSYGAFHLWFTVQVHTDWQESRLHLDEEQQMDPNIK